MPWLTPDAIPSETLCRQLLIPDDVGIVGDITGALLSLTKTYNWEKFGTVEPEEMAYAMRLMLLAYLDSECGATSVPTPFWDEDTDVDDQEPTATQTWYGTVSDPEAAPAQLDFVENAAVWIFTGFLAVATIEIGAAPAILFNTIAPRFILATKRGDLGEIIRILVDGEEAAQVDTSGYAAGEVIRTPIIGDPELTSHQVMIIQVS